MSRRRLHRIINVCTAVIVVAVLLLDHLDAAYRILANVSMVGAVLTMVISCFRYDCAETNKTKKAP